MGITVNKMNSVNSGDIVYGMCHASPRKPKMGDRTLVFSLSWLQFHVPLRACYLCCQLLTTSYFSNSAVIPALGKQTAMVSLKEGILGQHKAPSKGIF